MGAIYDAAKRLADAGVPVETILDTIRDMESLKPQRKAKADARATKLPADWTIPDEWIDWAMGEWPNMPVTFARQQSLTFKDYWVGRGKSMVDWLATWRNWMRRAVNDHRARLAKSSGSRPQSATERRREALAERIEENGYRPAAGERGDDPQDARRVYLARH